MSNSTALQMDLKFSPLLRDVLVRYATYGFPSREEVAQFNKDLYGKHTVHPSDEDTMKAARRRLALSIETNTLPEWLENDGEGKLLFINIAEMYMFQYMIVENRKRKRVDTSDDSLFYFETTPRLSITKKIPIKMEDSAVPSPPAALSPLTAPSSPTPPMEPMPSPPAADLVVELKKKEDTIEDLREGMNLLRSKMELRSQVIADKTNRIMELCKENDRYKASKRQAQEEQKKLTEELEKKEVALKEQAAKVAQMDSLVENNRKFAKRHAQMKEEIHKMEETIRQMTMDFMEQKLAVVEGPTEEEVRKELLSVNLSLVETKFLNEALKGKLEAQAKKLEDLEKETARREEEILQMSKEVQVQQEQATRIQLLESAIGKVQRSSKEAMDALQKKKEQKADGLNENLKAAKQERNDLLAKLTDKSNEVLKLEATLAESEAAVKTLQKAIQESELGADKHREEMETKERNIEELMSLLGIAQNSLKDAVESLGKEKEEAAELKDSLRVVEEERNDLHTKHVDSFKVIQDMKASLAEREDAVKTLQDVLEQSERWALEHKEEKAKKDKRILELDCAQNVLKTCLKEKEHIEEKAKDLEEALAQEKTARLDLEKMGKAMLKELCEQLETKETRIRELELGQAEEYTRNQEIKQELSGRSQEVIDLKAQLVKKEVALQDVHKQMTQQQENAHTAQQELEEEKNTLAQLMQDWEASQLEVGVKVNGLEAEVATLKSSLSEKQTSLQEAQEQLVKIRGELKELEGKKETESFSLTQELEEMKRSKDDGRAVLEDQIESLKTSLAEKETAITEAHDQLATLHKEVGELREQKEKEVSSLQIELGEMKKAQSEDAKRLEVGETTVVALETDLSEREAALHEVRNQLVQLREQVLHSEEAWKLAEDPRNQLITKKESLQSEVDDLKERNAQLTSVVQQRTAKIRELEMAKDQAGDLQTIERLTSALKNKDIIISALEQNCRSYQTLVELQKGTNQIPIDSPSYLPYLSSNRSTPRNKPSIPEYTPLRGNLPQQKTEEHSARPAGNDIALFVDLDGTIVID